MKLRSTLTLTILATVFGASGFAVAQPRLPDPPPPEGPPRGFVERAENIQDFVAAYKRAGSPRFLVYTDLVGVSGGANKTLNDAGAVTRLGARLEDLFHDPEVVIVNPGAANALTDQQVEAMRRNDEFAAAKMLGQAANADLVLYLRLLEQKGQNAAYTGSYILADLRRGESVGRYAWDMVPGPSGEFDSARMTEYARAIARRVIDQFAAAYPAEGSMAAMRRFTVKVVGDYEDDDLAGFRDEVAASKRVKPDSVILRSEDKSEGTAVATFELAFAGDLIDLRTIARRAAIDQMGMEATFLDSRDGSLTLRLAPLTLSDRERMLAGGPQTPRNKAERQKLAAAYENAGKPTLAVMFNMPVVDKDEPLPVDQSGGNSPVQSGNGVNIIIGDRVKLGEGGVSTGFAERLLDRELRERSESRRQDAAIDMRVFEDKIAGRLLQLGLQPRDLSAAQTELSAKPEFKDRKWTDRELAAALGKQAGADVVISGVGRLVRDNDSDAPQRVVLSIRAYNLANGDIIGATSVQKSLGTGAESFSQAIEELSAQATARLVAQMSDRWAAAQHK